MKGPAEPARPQSAHPKVEALEEVTAAGDFEGRILFAVAEIAGVLDLGVAEGLESAEVEAKQERYLRAIADATKTLQQEHNVFVVMCGSEALDRQACVDLNEMLGGKQPVFIADDFDMYDMVSIMRTAKFMVSSRYHACVTTMAGGVVSGGITMDERIHNLMVDRGQPHLSLDCADPDLESKTLTMMRTLVRDQVAIREGIDACIVSNLERMGQMGMTLVDHVKKRHPEFPFRPELGLHGDPWEHLPTFPAAVAGAISRTRGRA